MSTESTGEVNNDTIIDLTKDLNAQSFLESGIIHAREFKRAKDIILNLKALASKEFANSADTVNECMRKSSSSATPPPRIFHNTITLSGNRGSGKTSFLLSLLNDPCVTKDAFTLPIIDPTLIEDKGHIFLNIISRIKDHVDDVINENKISDECVKMWRNSLKELAQGLPTLEGVGASAGDWNDPTYVMEKGLQGVHGANHLALNFNKYVAISLKLLGKKVFIMAFDDVDTDFSKGWPVLETLRKYLTSPQLITILSGDLDLYSLLIRKKQWRNFGKTLLINEYDKDIEEFPDTRYTDLVTQLEGQYALKVLKPEYRISLTTIAQKMELEGRHWRVKSPDNDAENTYLKIFYKKIIAKWGIKESIIADLYFKFLTSLPIRSQLSILKFHIPRKIKETGEIEETSEDVDVRKKKETQDNITNITDVFYSDLKMMNVEVGDLVGGYGFTNIHILRFLIENKILDEGSQLIPKTNNPSINASLVAIGVVLSGRIKLQPFEIFDHMIRVSNVVAKADQWPLSDIASKPNIHDFVTHSRCYYDYGLKKISSLQCAYKASFSEVDLLSEGLIPIYGLRKLAKGKVEANTFRLDDLFKLDDKDALGDFLGYIPLIGAKDSLGRNQLVYSIFNILGTIGDLLFLTDGRDLLDEFIRQSQFREYPKFKNHTRFSDEDQIDEPDEPGNVDANTSLFNNKNLQNDVVLFIRSFMAWKREYKGFSIPPYFFGRIMVRTVYSLSKIKTNSNVGELLHRQIICFFNAVLVEEVMELGKTRKLNLANPTGSDTIFINNKENTRIQERPFFEWISRCPLLLAFTDTGDFSVFDELENLAINDKSVTNAEDVKVRPYTIYDATYKYLNQIPQEKINKQISYVKDLRKVIFAYYCYLNKISKITVLNELSDKDLNKLIFGCYDIKRSPILANLKKILRTNMYFVDEKTEWK